MTGRAWWATCLIVGGALTACAGGRGLEPQPAALAAWVPVQLGFEPPLLQNGVLQVRHEAGPVRTVATSCTGVGLSLPPGPVFLRLEVAGRVHERTLVVDPRQAEVVWTLSRP